MPPTEEVVISSEFYGYFRKLPVRSSKTDPGALSLSQYYWASSPSYSLGVIKVLVNGLRWLLQEVSKSQIFGLTRKFIVLLLEVLDIPLKE